MKRNLITLVVIMILEDTAAFQVLVSLVSLFCAWNITVEINSGVHLLKSHTRQLVPLFTSGGLGLVILVLVLRIWSCLHHCHTPYSWWGLLPTPQEPHPTPGPD